MKKKLHFDGDHFCIAGINVGISGYSNYNCDFFSSLEIFRAEKFKDTDITFHFTILTGKHQHPPSDFYIDPLYFHRDEDGLAYCFNDSGDATLSAKANTNWHDVEFVSNTASPDPNALSLLTDIAFRTRLPDFSGFSLHSSIIALNGTAVIFVGPSGIGKSTQAELWKEKLGASIINGDYGIVRQMEDGFHVYGAPWSGTSPYKTNTDYPISAVFLLKQSETNEVRSLDSFNTMQGFLPNCLLPYWHKPSLVSALDIVDKFLQAVPVYELKCRPDFDAVEIAHAALTL